ncbi:MAG: deoxyguanosinetriphosphate triphosphohydrolase [Armatimonadetes bacterium]|nr:deoxyguanosinetriphosphate triphosphohydrolase [Armatimonadota bacterium]
MHHIRQMIEERESQSLSPYAAKAADSQGRPTPEEQDPLRTAFQRDRDRILHSKSFRRLKHKTQVFISPQGDHYRTRMTHSLEVAQIARTIGRALRLNEDLIEAIALGHDLGHPPFGHVGERALDEALQAVHKKGIAGGPERFLHYEQSMRVVDVLENLNLTEETRAGIGGHSKGRNDLTTFDGEPTSTLEAAAVRISDRIAYMNHDLDDALRSGIVTEIPTKFKQLGERHSQRITAMVMDVIESSLDKPAIMMSPAMMESLNALKEWLFDEVYMLYPKLFSDVLKAEELVKELFYYYATEEGALPERFSGVQGAVDYVSGMTDRFAIDTFRKLRIPLAFAL